MFRKGTMLTVLMGLVLALLACTPAAPAPTPTSGKPAAGAAPTSAAPSTAPKAAFKVGAVLSLSGAFATLGLAKREAMNLVLEQVNAKGGINGHRLDLIIYDDESDETKGVLAAKKLITSDDVLMVIGPSSSGVGMALAPVAEEAKVPNLNIASTLKLADPVRKYVFKATQSERVMMEDIYAFLKKKGVSKIAVLNQGAAYGKGGREYIEKTAASNGFKVVAAEEYGPTDTDMRPQLTKIKATDAEYLVIYGAEAAGALAAKQLKEMGMKLPITGPMSLVATSALLDLAGDAFDGMLLPVGKSYIAEQLPDSDPQKAVIMSFKDAFKKKYNKDTGQWEGMGYDNLTIAVKALEIADPDPANLAAARDKLRDTVEGIKNLPLNVAVVSFSPTNHEGIPTGSQVIVEVRSKKFTVLK